MSWSSKVSSEGERLSIVGVGDDYAILTFERGGTHDLDGLQNQMRTLLALESRMVATSDRAERACVETGIRETVADVQSMIERCGRSDFDRLKNSATRISQLSIIGDDQYHQLPWELLCQYGDVQFANVPLVRRLKGAHEFSPSESIEDELRILFVTARANEDDVPPRAVIDPLLCNIDVCARVQPRVTVLRSGDFDDMADRLFDQQRDGKPAQILHLDLHGHVREGAKENVAELVFETPPDLSRGGQWIGGRSVSAKELTDVIKSAGVQVLVLNACHSASNQAGANFAYQVAELGVPAVIGIRRGISVPGAATFVSQFYKFLCSSSESPQPVIDSVALARRQMMRSDPTEASYPSVFITKTPPLRLKAANDGAHIDKVHRTAQAVFDLPRPRPVGRALDERMVRALSLIHI